MTTWGESSKLRWLTQILLVAVASYVSGRLGLLLAVTPGFATAVFPPAGIAFAVLLLWGRKFLLGVFLGALLLNVHVQLAALPGEKLWILLLTALAVAGGSTLQAIVGAWLVRRTVGLPARLLGEEDVAKFLLLGGPVSCLVAATCAIATLAFAGLMHAADCPFNWFTWWIGDALGVLVFAPLVMILFAEPRPLWRSRGLPVGVPLVVALVLMVGVFLYARQREQENLRLRFDQQAARLANAVANTFDRHVDVPQFVVGFYDSSEEVTRVEFQTFLAELFRGRPGIRAVEWVPQVRGPARADFEAQARSDADNERLDLVLREALQEFQFTQRSSDTATDARVVPAADRTEYFPVYFVEPYAGNEQALGFDLGSEPKRRAAALKCRDTAMPVVSERIALVQDGDQGDGVLLFLPVYRTAFGSPSVPERQGELQGFVSGVFHIADTVAQALEGIADDEIVLYIIDQAAPEDNQLIYAGPTSPTPPPIDTNRPPGVVEKVVPYTIADRQWTLKFQALPSFVAAQRDWQSWALLVGGLLFTGNLGAFLLVMTGRTSQIEALVTERTVELTRANLELERSNTDLQQFAYVASHDLQEPLRAVTSFCQLIEKKYGDKLDAQGAKYIHYAVDGAGRMKVLLSDLLEYSRVNTHGQPFRTVDCEEILATALANLHARIEESGAVVTRGPLPRIQADRTQIEQLLRNLIANAIKYCTAERPKLRVECQHCEHEWLFSVNDNGIGIDHEHLQRIFDIFHRLHTRGEYPGTGVGLAICKRIVQRHHGEIWVESEPGKGSTFYFTVPCDLHQHNDRRHEP